jgi:hypothetical protein
MSPAEKVPLLKVVIDIAPEMAALVQAAALETVELAFVAVPDALTQ